MNDFDHTAASVGTTSRLVPRAFSNLVPKGSCWYCNRPLDNVRRFCGKPCADDYLLEEEGFNEPLK